MNPICLTMGDPAGVGPELIIRLMGHLKQNSPPLFIVGDWNVLKAALKRFGRRKARHMFHSATILQALQKKYAKSPLTVLSTTDLDPQRSCRSEDRKSMDLPCGNILSKA